MIRMPVGVSGVRRTVQPGAIRLEDGEVVVDDEKCILCEVCSTKCPVAALKLERLSDES